MELHIKDRLLIPALLPKEGTFQQFNLKKSILTKIEVSAQEREDINLRENPETNRVEWDVGKDTPLVIMFTHEEVEYMKQAFEKIGDQPLHDEMWGTVEKIYNAIQDKA